MIQLFRSRPARDAMSRPAPGALSRRGVLLAPFALAGCDTIENWFTTKKDPLPGKREALGVLGRGFNPDDTAPKVALPPSVRNVSWPQSGGNPPHLMGNLSLNDTPKQLWSTDLGAGGGKRRQILAQPVAADGLVFAMDSEAVVSAYDLATGRMVWRLATVDKDVDSSNVGGGLCHDGGTIYAINGMSDLLALDAVKGGIRWRSKLDVPARSAPMVVEDRIFLTTIDSKLLVLSAKDGHVLWTYQATPATTTILGGPTPAYAAGIIVAGFGSGEIAALRAETGIVVWTDGLGIAGNKTSLADFMAIRGAPVIVNNQVFVTGMGGLTIAADLATGRRVWERRLASANALYAAGNSLFVLSTDQEAGAINIEDARIAWVAALPRWENPEKKKDVITWYGPIIAGGRLIVLGSNKEALFLNPANGTILSRQALSDAPAPFPPIVADGTMLIVTNDGRLTAWK